MDFQQAFDTLGHDALWPALLEQKVTNNYVNSLRKLYTNQIGCVWSDRTSKKFSIERGTNQGDPLSPVCLMQLLKHVWSKIKANGCRNTGVWNWHMAKTGTWRTYVLLMTSYWWGGPCFKYGRCFLILWSKVGLEIHPSKTNHLDNGLGKGQSQNSVVVRGRSIDILKCQDSTMYLGRLLNLVSRLILKSTSE